MSTTKLTVYNQILDILDGSPDGEWVSKSSITKTLVENNGSSQKHLIKRALEQGLEKKLLKNKRNSYQLAAAGKKFMDGEVVTPPSSPAKKIKKKIDKSPAKKGKASTKKSTPKKAKAGKK